MLTTTTYIHQLPAYTTLIPVSNSSLHSSHIPVMLRSVNHRLSKSIHLYNQNVKYAPLPDRFSLNLAGARTREILKHACVSGPSPSPFSVMVLFFAH